MDTLLLLVSALLVGLWVVAATFGLDVIRLLERDSHARHVASGRLRLVAPSVWQSVTA